MDSTSSRQKFREYQQRRTSRDESSDPNDKPSKPRQRTFFELLCAVEALARTSWKDRFRARDTHVRDNSQVNSTGGHKAGGRLHFRAVSNFASMARTPFVCKRSLAPAAGDRGNGRRNDVHYDRAAPVGSLVCNAQRKPSPS